MLKIILRIIAGVIWYVLLLPPAIYLINTVLLVLAGFILPYEYVEKGYIYMQNLYLITYGVFGSNVPTSIYLKYIALNSLTIALVTLSVALIMNKIQKGTINVRFYVISALVIPYIPFGTLILLAPFWLIQDPFYGLIAFVFGALFFYYYSDPERFKRRLKVLFKKSNA